MMNKFSRQYGVTLLEVLVGFVIFTASLVAVLDYVGGQVYLYQLSSSNLQKVQLTYDLSVISELGIEQQLDHASGFEQFNWSVSPETMEAFGEQDDGLKLKRVKYTVSDSDNDFEWTVLKTNQF